MNNFVELTEIYETSGDFKFSKHAEAGHRRTLTKNFSLRKVVINVAHVISLREELNYEQLLDEDMFPPGLDPRQKFTKIQVSAPAARFNSCIIVVGDVKHIVKKIQGF